MITKFTASAAAILLSTGAVLAQEANTQATGDASAQAGQTFDVVFIDVGGAAVQVPLALAAQACALATEEIQRTAQMRLEEQGLMPSDVGITPTASADASGTTGADAANTTQTADASAATDAGNATTETTQTAEAGATGDAASAEPTTEMAAGGDAAGAGAGEVENVEATAAETSADPAPAQDPFLVLAVCAVEPAQAASLNIDTTQTGETLGLDASRLQPADNQ